MIHTAKAIAANAEQLVRNVNAISEQCLDKRYYNNNNNNNNMYMYSNICIVCSIIIIYIHNYYNYVCIYMHGMCIMDLRYIHT